MSVLNINHDVAYQQAMIKVMENDENSLFESSSVDMKMFSPQKLFKYVSKRQSAVISNIGHPKITKQIASDGSCLFRTIFIQFQIDKSIIRT